MASLTANLEALAPTISELCKISGVAGVSIGVLHQGEVIFKRGFGYRDVEENLAPDADTIYYLGSMTKGFTAEAIAILVDEGKLSWNTPVKDLFREFQVNDSTITNYSTMIDLLGHRTGLERADALWAQACQGPLLSREQAMPTINQLRAVTPFRGQYRYNNWGYEIAGRIIESLSESSFSQFLKEKIFEPLEMTRTFNDDVNCHGADNIAKAYSILDDYSTWQISRPTIVDGTLMNPAGGIQSTINDLLKYYGALLKSSDHQFESRTNSTPGSPLKQLSTLLSGHISTAPSIREQSYALGWARAQLPGALCDTSRNAGLISPFPIIGDPKQPRLAIYHHGMLVGAANAVYLFPESETAVVLLSNSVAFNDGPDWIGHLIIQTIFNDTTKHDYLKLAQQTADVARGAYAKVEEQLAKSRVPGGPPRPLADYVGTYRNNVKTFFIDVAERDGKLWMNFQGNKEETYLLSHSHEDEFTWLMTRDDQVKRSRNAITWADFWRISFDFGGTASPQRLFWIIEPELPKGMPFIRDTPPSHSEL
jgi:CubicO group peptidase (beta-lactamase class C family)